MRRLRLAIQDGVTEGRVRFRRKLLLWLAMKIWFHRKKRESRQKSAVRVTFSRVKISTINSKSWIIYLCFCWRQCIIYCCIVSLLPRLPSIIFCKIKSVRRVSWFAILDSYVAFAIIFPLTDIHSSINSKIKFGRNSTYKSAVALLPHLIELNSTRQKCDVWTGPKTLSNTARTADHSSDVNRSR